MSDELEQMTPNQRRALNKALSALEEMAAIWASEIRLTDMSQRIADVPDAAERAKRIAAMIEQGFIEGAYRHYLDHKDEILHVDALEAANARIAALESQIAALNGKVYGWKLVPVEPTEEMVVDGFESWPSRIFSEPEDWAAYEAMSGCRQAAHKARLCYAAMLAAAPSATAATVAPAVDAQPVGEIWEYSYIHSSATGRGETKIGRCLTYDKKTAFGVGCIDQRLLSTAWQPIETAPKTGCTLLLGYPNVLGKWRTARGQWMSEAYIAESWEEPDDAEPGWYETSVEAEDPPNCWYIEPTHWMPLPAAPAAAIRALSQKEPQ